MQASHLDFKCFMDSDRYMDLYSISIAIVIKTVFVNNGFNAKQGLG